MVSALIDNGCVRLTFGVRRTFGDISSEVPGVFQFVYELRIVVPAATVREGLKGLP